MPFEIVSEHLDKDVKVIRPIMLHDHRGSFTVSYLEDEYVNLGISRRFVREMYTRSNKNVLRGLHFQTSPWMGKLIQVIKGYATIAVVDIRETSPFFLKHVLIGASGASGLQVWIPAGFALGYYTAEDDTIVHYKCDQYLGVDKCIYWNDSDIGIKWPLIDDEPILSERDDKAPPAWSYFWRYNGTSGSSQS
jgi:dTDP-4-dehydrorhamnose 3,5-epimerase